MPKIQTKPPVHSGVIHGFEVLRSHWHTLTSKPVLILTSALVGVPKGSRTPVVAVKGRCPRPLDDGDDVCSRKEIRSPHQTGFSRFGGARRDRTADLNTASVALSQLSYGPSIQKAKSITFNLIVVQSFFRAVSWPPGRARITLFSIESCCQLPVRQPRSGRRWLAGAGSGSSRAGGSNAQESAGKPAPTSTLPVGLRLCP